MRDDVGVARERIFLGLKKWHSRTKNDSSDEVSCKKGN